MAPPPPAFADIAKPSLDLLNKDFYHTAAATLEVRSKAPNGVAFTVKGKSDHKSGAINGQVCIVKGRPAGYVMLILNPSTGTLKIEAKYTDKPTGLTLTQAWTTFNALDTKVEIAQDKFKLEALTQFLPSSKSTGAKLNLHYRHPNFHTRAFFDLLKGPTFTGDLCAGSDGFLAGGDVSYDVTSAKITRYSAGVGYSVPEYTAALNASNNFSLFAASYYHRVNAQVEAGARAVYDAKNSSQVGLEVGSKYRLDPLTFVKAKINNSGIAALAYNQVLRPGVTIGLGLAVDTQRLGESAHKFGASFTFEG